MGGAKISKKGPFSELFGVEETVGSGKNENEFGRLKNPTLWSQDKISGEDSKKMGKFDRALRSYSSTPPTPRK